MIKIIERGTKSIMICNSCGCKFSFEREDVISKDTDNYKGFKEYVNCPQCEEEVVIRQSK